MAFTARHDRRHDGNMKLYHLVVIAVSLVVTLGAWRVADVQIHQQIRTRFEDARDRTLGLITDRMHKYEDALWSGVAAIESHGGDMSLSEWRQFAGRLRIEERYPGINGIGVIHFVDRSDLGAYLERRRAEQPGFEIYPPHAFEQLMPISFIEPVGINQAAVGLDVAHEVNRRNALLASLDTAEARITGPINLVQDADSTPGFLFYAPFYEGGRAADGEERRARAAGAVYAPFVIRSLMDGLLAKELRGVYFSIRDGAEMIYDEHVSGESLQDPDPMLRETVRLDLYGRTWVIDFRTNLAFRASNSHAQPTMILIAGLLIEAIIVALLVLMSRANRSAVDYAKRVNEALRAQSARLAKANRKLAAANEELEQFTYITSHDLKTPIRGIGGLTELIEEDLTDYFASPEANPDVKGNLELIRDRVRRMTALTRGIMEYSRIGADSETDGSLFVQDAIAAMRADFGMTEEELRLVGDSVKVDNDASNFRRVLENLVGNALKHHDDRERLSIIVATENKGPIARIAVTDNGPGIDARFHDRIFDVFQTLRVAKTPENTGIGLAMVKKAVERHGGKVTIRSEPGRGSTFAFDWPIVRGADAPVPARAAA